MSFSPSCMVRLPPENWLVLRKLLPAVMSTKPAANGLAFVAWSSAPLFDGRLMLGQRWLNVLYVSARNCIVNPSRSFVLLSNAMFQRFRQIGRASCRERG